MAVELPLGRANPRRPGNGVAGQGAGILMAGAAPGTGVHDNVVSQ